MTHRRSARAARDLLLLHLALVRCVVRWVTGRPDVPSQATAIGYGQLVGPMLWLLLFASVTESIVVEVVVHQIDAGWAGAVGPPLLVLGIWLVLVMLGLLATCRVRPHLLTPDRLRVRIGPRSWVDVPLTAVAGTGTHEHDLPAVLPAMHLADGLLLVGVNGRTNLELVLAGPTVLATSRGEMLADRIGLWVDEPRVVAQDLRAAATPSGPA